MLRVRAAVSPSGRSRADWPLAALIAAATAAWFALQPRNLGPADESYMLVEASRVVHGERMYRDIFWFAMPGAHWLLAAAFSLFGTTITTAKLFIGAVNACTAALAYLTTRALGGRIGWALLPPMAFLALAQPAWPFVSPHWLSTMLIMALLLALAPSRALERPPRLFWAGVALGALGAIHQQKAPVLGVGVAIAVGVACAVRRAPAAPRGWARLAIVAAGAALVLVPVLGVMVATTPVERLVDDVLRFPLTSYRRFHDIAWGEVSLLTAGWAAYVSPLVLRWLPILLVLGGATAALGCRRGWPRARVVQWSTLLLVCACSALAIGYNADFIHIAFIAAPFFVLAALLGNEALAMVPGRERPIASAFAVAALALVLGMHMARNARRMAAHFPLGTETRFGRVDFATQEEIDFTRAVERQLDTAGRRDLFVYPAYASLYLTAGGTNATRYQLLLPAMSHERQFAEVYAALDRTQVPTVVVQHLFLTPGDPMLAYLARHYVATAEGRGWTIYQRRT